VKNARPRKKAKTLKEGNRKRGKTKLGQQTTESLRQTAGAPAWYPHIFFRFIF